MASNVAEETKTSDAAMAREVGEEEEVDEEEVAVVERDERERAYAATNMGKRNLHHRRGFFRETDAVLITAGEEDDHGRRG